MCSYMYIYICIHMYLSIPPPEQDVTQGQLKTEFNMIKFRFSFSVIDSFLFQGYQHFVKYKQPHSGF